MILLTGGSGFIGKTFKKNFNIDKIRQVVRCRLSEEADFFKIDHLGKNTDWNGAFNGVHTVVHIAGVAHCKNKSSEYIFDVNFLGTASLADEAAKAGVKRFIYISTIGVHGDGSTNEIVCSKSKLSPNTAYAKSKLLAENHLLELSVNSGLEIVIIRPPLVYGENAPGNFGKLAKLVNFCPILPFGSFNNLRSMISVDNLSDFISYCIYSEKVINKTFVVADTTLSTFELVTAMLSLNKKRNTIISIPLPILKMSFKLLGKEKIFEQLAGPYQVDLDFFLNESGWKPKSTVFQTFSSKILK